MSCDEGHCITCADEAVRLRVETVQPDGTVVCDGREVMTELVGEVEAGDELLVHAGVALVRL